MCEERAERVVSSFSRMMGDVRSTRRVQMKGNSWIRCSIMAYNMNKRNVWHRQSTREKVTYVNETRAHVYTAHASLIIQFVG